MHAVKWRKPAVGHTIVVVTVCAAAVLALSSMAASAQDATYIKDPRAAMPGSKMAIADIKDEKDVADLAAYISNFDAMGKPTK